eukprot:TRINITY_DN13257_c0_g1_i1.p1 TRINITY_DN13257_c0_g1~~TRINITY_DN13257_c0_g1_i1.p1  ORF type:complete len:181 (-),score=4.96 TRINITY_DN13257_c0_g1_i1:226-768(-)
MELPPVLDLMRWYEENKTLLQPPVCNALPYGTNHDFQVMAIGGPNVRRDFHFEDHEEFFLQIKGKMVLRVVDKLTEEGVPTIRDVTIPEGGMFLLPPHVWHSPQRFADTFGIVVEKRRSPTSVDRLRWFCANESCGRPVYEATCTEMVDLTKQIKPIIDQWKTDESLRRCKHCGHIAPPQ